MRKKPIDRPRNPPSQGSGDSFARRGLIAMQIALAPDEKRLVEHGAVDAGLSRAQFIRRAAVLVASDPVLVKRVKTEKGERS